MSHRIGTVQQLAPAITVGPDAGPSTSPNTWLLTFTPVPAPTGTKFVILHFTGASFPASNSLEVDLGYGQDVFTSADGGDFWTRPIKLSAAGTVAVRYISNGSAAGHVTLKEYGRGENVESGSASSPGTHNLSNPDVFLLASPYVEPFNETRGICGSGAPNWENATCALAGSAAAQVTPSVCLFIHAEINETTGLLDLSSCTGTLIGPDLVLCAGHCVSDPLDLNVVSGSVTFDFQTNCDRTRPTGYNPRFFKVNRAIRVMQTNPSGAGGLDYSLLQLKVPVPGVPSVPMRADLPKVNDPVFEVHHPQGIAKKVSPRGGGTLAKISSVSANNGFTYLFANTDLTGGSSGSALFDMSGKVIGIADIAGGCANGFLSITEVLRDIAATPPSVVKRDVMMVLDRSGSMSLPAGTGRTKIEEARDAAALFVELIRVGAGDKIGLVSFSTTASSPVDFDLHTVDTGAKNSLIGPAPFTGGFVGGLAPTGLTSIGGGLEAASARFPAPGPGVNKRTILLMTDGLQNTPPMIADAAPAVAGVDLSVVGFGAESSLDGVLLDRLAQAHGGMYTRAGSPLQLKKFFALAFGNIFASGTLSDPEYELPAAERSKSIPFRVCSEDSIAAVLGWNRDDTSLVVVLKTPSGAFITAGSPGAESSSGHTWTFLRVPLPFGGDRDGTWEAQVVRPGGGEFPPPGVDLRFFLNIVVEGGPKLERLNPDRQHYTGDKINPLVVLRNGDGTVPRRASVKLTVTKPVDGAGNVLTQAGLGQPTAVGGDAMPARQSTLLALESTSGTPAITYQDETLDLFDDGDHEDGAMEPDGIFGNPLPDLLASEGTYNFHAVATYGDDCVATREALWSVHIDIGIDPGHTEIHMQLTGTGPGGQKSGTITITPRDPHGNHLGPGRADAISLVGVPGTTVTGPVTDNGDGTYIVPVGWDPGAGQEPGIIVGQPDRPPVVLQGKQKRNCRWWKLLALLLFLLLILLLVVVMFDFT
ncbi:MAG: trypsin-like peptidase domain-containing protein [Gaiellaceae bacterium]